MWEYIRHVMDHRVDATSCPDMFRPRRLATVMSCNSLDVPRPKSGGGGCLVLNLSRRGHDCHASRSFHVGVRLRCHLCLPRCTFIALPIYLLSLSRRHLLRQRRNGRPVRPASGPRAVYYSSTSGHISVYIYIPYGPTRVKHARDRIGARKSGWSETPGPI